MNNKKIAEKNFEEFQKAWNKKIIDYQKGDIHDDIILHMDRPEGQLRLTYGLIGTGLRLKATCVAVPTDPHKEKPCFDIGVATLRKFRRQGHGKLVLEKVIDELKNGLNRNGTKEFYIELKVDKANEVSHKLCRYFSDETIEHEMGTTYLKLIE